MSIFEAVKPVRLNNNCTIAVDYLGGVSFYTKLPKEVTGEICDFVYRTKVPVTASDKVITESIEIKLQIFKTLLAKLLKE